ncbi:type VII toxin-antitoxin system HepT family RNase toxin [Halorhabdus salina]
MEILVANQSVSRESFRERPETRDVVERRLEKSSQACIDIARMLVRDIDGHAPGSNAATMRRLGEIDVLTDETAESMAEAAMFRNVLAHEYGDVLDQDVVYDALQDLGRYREFLVEIYDYLDEVGAL